MDTLKAMQVFVEVARQQGFAPAARRLELSTSSVSRHVDNLEKRLKRQLFRRSTRHLALTQAGMDLLGRCEKIVQESDDLFRSVSTQTMAPSGRLKITIPQFLATLLSQPFIAAYLQQHPELEFDMVVLTRVVNLAEEDYDLAIRVGNLPDSSLKARKLLDMKLVMVASPEYVAQHGVPRNPADLASHNCIVETESPYFDRWPLTTGQGKRHVKVTGNARVNNGEIARELATGGAGIALIPLYMAIDQLQSGRLVTLMDEQMVEFGGVYAVYSNTRYPSINVHSFIHALLEYLEAAQLRH